MNTSKIYEAFKEKTSLDYILENTYIFAWESDIFGISKAGYINEIEVKSSRGDFKNDFIKRKHLILQAAYNKKETAVFRGDLNFSYKIKEFKRNRETWRNEWTGNYIEGTSYTSGLKPPKKNDLKRAYEETNLISTNIKFVKIFCPHRFYYACPKGLIQKDEVPKYAGLYWVAENGDLIMKKQAPILHKLKYSLTMILLDKFYQKSMSLATDLRFLKMQYEHITHKDMDGHLIDKIENIGMQTNMKFINK